MADSELPQRSGSAAAASGGTAPASQGTLEDASSQAEIHDVIVYPQATYGADGFRIAADRADSPAPSRKGGFFRAPVEVKAEDQGGRLTRLLIGRRCTSLEATRVKAAFAVTPIKPEPIAAAGIYGYLISADQLNLPNLWTVEEWNDDPNGPDFSAPEHPDSCEALIAAPWGKVFRLELRREPKAKAAHAAPGYVDVCPGYSARVTDVSLRAEPEIWAQLRSGCIAGRVATVDDPEKEVPEVVKEVPLVNITALMSGVRCVGG